MKDFTPYRSQVIGIDQTFATPYGEKRIIYADWTASGRLYRPIEEYIANRLGPFVANTHTETTVTGTHMTAAYRQAQQIIKRHVHANDDDAIFFSGFGMTAVINKLQRLLGLRIPDQYCGKLPGRCRKKPLVVITHMEHHSNHTSWNECYCHVEIIRRGADGLPDLDHLEEILKRHKDRDLKIGSFTACSNVTGIHTPYHADGRDHAPPRRLLLRRFRRRRPLRGHRHAPGRSRPAPRRHFLFAAQVPGRARVVGSDGAQQGAVPQPRPRPSRRRHGAVDQSLGRAEILRRHRDPRGRRHARAFCRPSAPPWPSS